MIETLEWQRQDEFIDVIGAAFREHPHIPPDPSGRRSRRLASSILSAFKLAPNAHLFGIRCDGRVDCAAFVFDADYEPRGWRLLLFMIRMLQVVGWGKCRVFSQVMAAKPQRQGRQLELMLLGTRIGYQQQGYGRAMIRHVLEFARGQGYASVVLEVAKETPAFGFYLSEGFISDKEVDLPIMPLCFLRCPLSNGAADDAETAPTGQQAAT